jgi:hypothetical protein
VKIGVATEVYKKNSIVRGLESVEHTEGMAIGVRRSEVGMVARMGDAEIGAWKEVRMRDKAMYGWLILDWVWMVAHMADSRNGSQTTRG